MPAVTVYILGQKYTLQAASNEDHLLKVAEHLNKRIEEVERSGGTTTTLGTAVLAALNIANELIQLRDQQSNLLKEIEGKAERLLERIELQKK